MTNQLACMLEFISAAGQVRRYHVCTVLKDETVAAHSFEVAWIAWLVYGRRIRVPLLLAALAHDMAELVVGDMPAHTKRMLSAEARTELYSLEQQILESNGVIVGELTLLEQSVLEVSDRLALLMHCARELQLGNTTMRKVFYRGSGYALESINEVTDKAKRARALALHDALFTQYAEIVGGSK